MAAGTYSDLVMNTPFYNTGMAEVLNQYTDVFNSKAGNVIQLVPQALIGQYNTEDFFQNVSGIINRRDSSSVDDATILKLTQSSLRGVKLDRGLGPVSDTVDSLNKINVSSEAYSLTVGRIAAKAMLVDYLNAGLLAAVAAMKSNTASLTDTTQLGAIYDKSSNSISSEYLADALALFGDASANISCWIMHSRIYYDLVKQNLSANLSGLSDVIIYGGVPGTFGKPVYITDSSSLITTGSPNVYHVLGLTSGAIRLIQSETTPPFSGVVPLKKNLLWVIQGEHSFNVMIKGYAYQTTGGVNPTNAVLGSSTYWSQVATDDKDTAGVVLHVIKASDATKTV